MVFYFTGTGNSLYVAKQLEEKRISIPQAIHEEELVFEGDTIGVVCPLYGHEMPAMVKEFLRRAVFRTEYFYLVLTYGKRHGGGAELAKEFWIPAKDKRIISTPLLWWIITCRGLTWRSSWPSIRRRRWRNT